MRKIVLFCVFVFVLCSPIYARTLTQKSKVRFYKGVDLMKLTKDSQRNPLSLEEKDIVMERAVELGATHVAIVTPYDNTSDGIDPITDTREWVQAARNHDLLVSHRHMFNEAEGTYDVQRNLSTEFQVQMIEDMQQWMIRNTDLIQDGDTWTPMPEPQNLGVVGINCSENCLFQSVEQFNMFITRIVTVAHNTLVELNKNVEVVCCGFDGFVVAGNNNPDWEGKSFLDTVTVETMQNTIAIDHYPQADWNTGIRRTYLDDLAQITLTWPHAQLYLTEVGHPDIDDAESVESMFQAFKHFADMGTLRGVWWWPLNASGLDEGLLDESFSPRDIFYEVQAGFASLPNEVFALNEG